MNRLLLLCTCGIASIISLSSARVNAGELIGGVDINISGNITVQPCSAASINDETLSHNIGDLKIADIVALGQSKVKEYLVGKEIGFTCTTGEYAKFSISLSPSDYCYLSSRPTEVWACSGENKSVGIGAEFSWTDKDSKAVSLWATKVQGFNETKTVKLVNRVGKIKLINGAFSQVKGVEPRPGPIGAHYILNVWSD